MSKFCSICKQAVTEDGRRASQIKMTTMQLLGKAAEIYTKKTTDHFTTNKCVDDDKGDKEVNDEEESDDETDQESDE